MASNDKFFEQIQYIYTCCLILYNTQFAFTNSSFFSQGGDDFVSQQFTLTFPAGQTRAEFTVAITDDSLIEATEYFQLLLSIPEDLIFKGVQVGPNSAATVTIMDNDGELNGINCVHGGSICVATCMLSLLLTLLVVSLVCIVCVVSKLYPTYMYTVCVICVTHVHLIGLQRLCGVSRIH